MFRHVIDYDQDGAAVFSCYACGRPAAGQAHASHAPCTCDDDQTDDDQAPGKNDPGDA